MDHDGRLFSERQSREMWSPQTILNVGDPPAALAGLKANFADYGWAGDCATITAASWSATPEASPASFRG